MNGKIVVFVSVIALVGGAAAYPYHRGWRPGPYPMHHGYSHHYSYWGAGGRHFWPGFAGGVIGGAIAGSLFGRETVVVAQPTAVATPVVVTQPVVIQQPVVVQQPVVQQQPVVIQQPVVQQPIIVQQPQTVWVEGRYVDQVQGDGSVIRVWQPGHYEQR